MTHFAHSHSAFNCQSCEMAYEEANITPATLSCAYFEQTGDGRGGHTSVEELYPQVVNENFSSPRVKGGNEVPAEIQDAAKRTTAKFLKYAKGFVFRNYRGLQHRKSRRLVGRVSLGAAEVFPGSTFFDFFPSHAFVTSETPAERRAHQFCERFYRAT